MPSDYRDQAGDAEQEDSSAIADEDCVHEVLSYAEAQNREPAGESNDQNNDQPLLPGSRQPAIGAVDLRAQLLDQGNHDISRRDHHQHTGPPGAETTEEAPERAKSFSRPDIDRAFAGEHQAQLAGHDGTGNEERDETEYPVNIPCRAGSRCHDGRVGDEEDDCNENSDHIEGIQDFGENASCDPL